MSKSLIKTLLRVYQSEADDFSVGAALKDFSADFGIGQRKGSRMVFTQHDREQIGLYLKNIHGIEPSTSVDAWNGIERHEAAKISSNEKMSSNRVMSGRVAIKSLPGRPLCINCQKYTLPQGSNLDISVSDLLVGVEHDSVLLIENWENFQYTDQTSLLNGLPGNPLVIFRGDPNVYNPKHSLSLMKKLTLPVDAFVDYDPEGLVIANALPHLRTMICPDEAVLEKLLVEGKNQDRFTLQKKEAIATLERLENPQLLALWRVFDRIGNALPQEVLIWK